MNEIYHGSSKRNLKVIEPKKSTHGKYVYATKDKILALHFCKKCGDDLTYDIGHFSNSKEESWQLVEKIPKALEKMYNTTASIYTVSDEKFKNINTGFEEVVSEENIEVIKEEYYENLYSEILKEEEKGNIIIYRYPNKPDNMQKDNSNILEKWRMYKNKLNKKFEKYDFDRLVLLHPKLLDKINELIIEFGYDYRYTEKDIINIFKERVKRQIENPKQEEFIESAYISIIEEYPNLKNEISEIYFEFVNKFEAIELKQLFK